tara:strand:+ start:276 stop:458 length:183 start_codon:yes stop_codon:yes gene_type:complete
MGKVKVTVTSWAWKLNLGWFGEVGSQQTLEFIGPKKNLENIKSDLNTMKNLVSWNWEEVK